MLKNGWLLMTNHVIVLARSSFIERNTCTIGHANTRRAPRSSANTIPLHRKTLSTHLPPLPFLLPILILVQLEAIRVTHVKMVHNKVFKTRLFLGSLVRVQTVGLNISESYVFYYFFISICVRLVHRVSFPLSHRCFLFDFVRNVLGEERVGIYALRGTLRV